MRKRPFSKIISSPKTDSAASSFQSAKRIKEDQSRMPSSASAVVNAEADWPLPGAVQRLISTYVGNVQREPTSDPEFQDTKIVASDTKAFNQNSLTLFITHLCKNSLLEYVVRGEERQAQAMIHKNPSLAFDKVHDTVIDYSGREITGQSAFQHALCAGDVDMAEMIKQQVLKAKDSEALLATMQTQFNQIFPEGNLQAHAERQKKDTFDFAPIFNAIKNAPDNELTAARQLKGTIVAGKDYKKEREDQKEQKPLTLITQALNQFRYDFTQRSRSPEQKIFNPYDLLTVFHLYAEKFDELDLWNKHELFFCQVIGFVQRFLPTCYVQAVAQGNDSLLTAEYVNRRMELKRWKRWNAGLLRYWGGVGPNSLGFGCVLMFFGLGCGVHRGIGMPLRPWARSSTVQITKIMSSKNSGFGQLYASRTCLMRLR